MLDDYDCFGCFGGDEFVIMLFGVSVKMCVIEFVVVIN